MFAWLKHPCISCGQAARSLSKTGVCSNCQLRFQAELDLLFATLNANELRFKRLKDPQKRVDLAGKMAADLRRVMGIEALGIWSDKQGDVLLPSQWLSQYESEHDWALCQLVEDKFNGLWNACFHHPYARSTITKLKDLLEETLEIKKNLRKDPHQIDPIEARIKKTLEEREHPIRFRKDKS